MSIWTFALRFSEHTVYWRNFTVDAPPVCKKQQCAVLVDFHPYYSNSREEREWTRWFAYQRDTEAPFVLVTPDGSGDVLSGEPGEEDETERQGWNTLGWGERAPAVAHDTRRCKRNAEATCLDWGLHQYRCYASQLELDPAACSPAPEEPDDAHRHRKLAARRVVTRLRNLLFRAKGPEALPEVQEEEEEAAAVRALSSGTCATMSAQYLAQTDRKSVV